MAAPGRRHSLSPVTLYEMGPGRGTATPRPSFHGASPPPPQAMNAKGAESLRPKRSAQPRWGHDRWPGCRYKKSILDKFR